MLAMLLMNRMSIKKRNARKQQLVRAAKTENITSLDCCRTCLTTADLMSIFCNKESEDKRSEDLKLVTGLDIKQDDGLPQKMCSQCLELVNLALQFRRTSRKAEKTLISLISDIEPKVKKKSSKSKAVKSPKLRKQTKEEIEYIEEDEVAIEFDQYEDDFQNNYEENYGDENDTPLQVLKEKASPPKKRRQVIPNQSSYKCHICKKEFRMKATYKAHMRFHTNYCVCEACGKRCRNNNQLQEHKRARHGLGRIHKCAYCEYSSATKEALTIHERRHTGERPYICDHCGATFHRRSNLVQHIAIHLPENNFQCPLCPKKEKSRKRLAIHEYKYHRENKYRYICPICQDSFTRPGNVRQHLSRSHRIPREHQGVIDRLEVSLPLLSESSAAPHYVFTGEELRM